MGDEESMKYAIFQMRLPHEDVCEPYREPVNEFQYEKAAIRCDKIHEFTIRKQKAGDK